MKITLFLAGLGVGAAVAMLLTPRSGDETREVLSEKAAEGRRYAKARLREMRDVANDVVEAAHVAKDTYNRESEVGVS